MSRGESPKKELRALSHTGNKRLCTSEEVYILGDDQSKNSTVNVRDIQTQDLNKGHIPKPPKGRQKPVLTAGVHKTQPADEVRNAVRGAHPVNQDPDSQPLDYAGPVGLRFDDQGMVLPHSILGSLEDFRSYLELKGETELLKQIPKSQRDGPSEASGKPPSEPVGRKHGIPTSSLNIQSNALHHWQTHMRQRRRQQGFLSDLLDRSMEDLLMNQADCFRETQEQREFLNQVMPLIHSEYGYRVGSEFWSLPQRYGDEMSGITATLTQTEQGRWKPVTHVRQPSSIRQESGTICAEALRPASRTWDQSVYLQRQCQELTEVLQDMNIKKPDMDGLEVIGSGRPFTCVKVCRSPLLEKEGEEEEHTEMKTENIDPPAQYDDVQSNALLIPALRFCGQLASWTGNSTTNQGEVGICATILFEALTGEIASSHLELHNEGSTAIFYSWQQLPVPHSFPNLRSQTKRPCFYFNTCGVILPGHTQRVEILFKSEKPGIQSERWQLNTHPVLLRGASMQVTLKGVALYQDKTADQRLFLEKKLETIVTEKMCRSIVYEVLQGVRTPERPSSPAELYITEEREFLSKNPKLQYLDQPVEDLRRLWHEVNPGRTWDLCVDTLRQAVLSLPGSAQEESLAQLNSLLLQLSGPSEQKHHHLTAAALGQQLWRKLLDSMADEAERLRNLLDRPKTATWKDKNKESLISDADMADNKDEKSERKGGAAAKEERRGARRGRGLKMKESKTATTEKSLEDTEKKGKRKDEVGKHTREKQGKDSSSLNDIHVESVSEQTPDDRKMEPEVRSIYTRLLYRKVYALMEDLVDNLCDLMDEMNT